MEALNISLGVLAEMPLENIAADSDLVKGYVADSGAWEGWYADRCGEKMMPLFGIDKGLELTIKPAVTYTMDVDSMTFGAYADMNFCNYNDAEKYYATSDSNFRVKFAGASFSMKPEYSDLIKGVNVYYGFDLSNAVKAFNTLVGKVSLKDDWTVNAAIGIKTENTLSAAEFNADANNPFAFAVGVSKQFKAMKKPTVYAQFVYNMDPFKHFGDGQDALNMDRSNVKGSWQKEGVGDIDPVDWYDGRAAMRVGIRWDI